MKHLTLGEIKNLIPSRVILLRRGHQMNPEQKKKEVIRNKKDVCVNIKSHCFSLTSIQVCHYGFGYPFQPALKHINPFILTVI